jgi:hypothetical protein
VDGHPSASLNSPLALALFFTRSLITCSLLLLLLLHFLTFHPTMGRGKRGKGWPRRADGKRKHPQVLPQRTLVTRSTRRRLPPSMIDCPLPHPPVASSEDSDDSMGLSTTARAYWRSIERAELGGLDDS